MEAQSPQSSTAVGPSGLMAGSLQTYSSAASSPAPGSISSPLPGRALIAEDSDSNSNSDAWRVLASGVGGSGRKRARENDDFADADESEEPTTPASAPAANVGPAKSGVMVQGTCPISSHFLSLQNS